MAVYQPMWVVRARHWWCRNRHGVTAYARDCLVALGMAVWFIALATVMLGWSA